MTPLSEASAADDRQVNITVDGTELRVPASRTIAAALMLDLDRSAWRRTRQAGEPRGLFCGIGICYDCLATIDGRTSVRACMVEVAEGMDVRTGRDPRPEEGEHS